MDRFLAILQASIDAETLAADLDMADIEISATLTGYIPAYGTDEWNLLVNVTEDYTTVADIETTTNIADEETHTTTTLINEGATMHPGQIIGLSY